MTLLLDTDDFVMNSQLVPIANSMNRKNIHIEINYKRINEFCIVLKNRLIIFLLLAIKNIIK